jgi:hypothetical protein
MQSDDKMIEMPANGQSGKGSVVYRTVKVRWRSAVGAALLLLGVAAAANGSTRDTVIHERLADRLASLPTLQSAEHKTSGGMTRGSDDGVSDNAEIPLVVVTLSSVCPCSGSHLGHLAALAGEFQNFRFIGLMTDLPADPAQQAVVLESLQADGRGLEVRNDVQLDASRYLGAETTPHVFVRDQQGGTLYQGAVTSSSTFHPDNGLWLREALVAISNGEAPLRASTPPSGCSISY